MFDIQKMRAKGFDAKTISVCESINENTRRRESCTGHEFDVSKFGLKHRCKNCGCEESIEYIQGYKDGLKHAEMR